MNELVSCVMATGGRRRHFLAQALRCFASQTYQRRELIVVDDGPEPLEDLCAASAGVTYLRLRRRTPTGAKLNLGIEAARGSILQKLDDDDFYAPGFLAASAGRIQASRLKRSIAAWDSFLVLLAGSPRLRMSGRGWLAGGTLCFRREVWQAQPFRPVARDEDALFLADHPGPRLRIRAPGLYVLVRHGRNTWRSFGAGVEVDQYFATRPVWPQTMMDLTDGPASRCFYAALTAPGPLPA